MEKRKWFISMSLEVFAGNVLMAQGMCGVIVRLKAGKPLQNFLIIIQLLESTLQKANGGFVKNAQEYNSGKSNNIKWLYWFL